MRVVPTALQSHHNQVSTTTCRLLKIRTKRGEFVGLTNLDQDVSYDDGESSDGSLTYSATNGFDPTALAEDLGFSVGNAEGFALISESVPGVTAEMIRAGELDDATWVTYQVNYKDLSQGHIMIGFGDVGQVRPLRGAMQWVMELLSLPVRVKQPIGGVFSIPCRAEFGTPADSQTGCGVDISSKWVYGTVQSVGVESDRTFTANFLTSEAPSQPRRLQFLTGDNAGREFVVETIAGMVVSLLETTPYPIQAGDTYRIRPDCWKRYRQDCINVWDNGLNFKGEPLIPAGDGVASQLEDAELPGGGGVLTSVAEDVD